MKLRVSIPAVLGFALTFGIIGGSMLICIADWPVVLRHHTSVKNAMILTLIVLILSITELVCLAADVHDSSKRNCSRIVLIFALPLGIATFIGLFGFLF
ncbi:MAG: hypothetical protein O3A80_00005 [bacterium]|nr:hypothetical protein [bacterium]